MASLTQIKQRFWNNDGTVAAGGKVYVYLAGTSTLTNSYTDSTGSVPNNNPVILDSKGEAAIFTDRQVKLNIVESDVRGNAQITGYPMDYTGQVYANQFYATSILVNETFLVNNGNTGVAYVSGAVLASGTYGHEMWKAGAGGGDYTFTQNPATSQITIATGKTLIQVIAGAKVCSTTYVLSWTGTAQARYAVNSVTPAGTYAVSPIYITGQTIGTTMSIEFNTGTLSEPALIEGTILVKAIRKNSDLVRKEAEIYYEQSLTTDTGVLGNAITSIATTTSIITGFRFRTTKITSPTVTLFSRNGTSAKISSSATGADVGTVVTVLTPTLNGVFLVSDSGTGFTVGTVAYEIFYTANSRV